MKKIIYYTVIITILAGCASSQKYLQKGRYDDAINKAVKVLRKKPTSEKNILALEKAYKIANEKDNERVNYLKLEGRADRWDEIFKVYSRLKYRQSKVKTVLPLELHGRTIDFPYIDYDKEIVSAKSNAADYYFAHGQKLMKEKKLESYRQAYYEFKKVKQYSGDYGNVNALIDEARFLGTSRVLIKIYNETHLKLPQNYLNDLISFSTSGLNSEWVQFYTKNLDKNTDFNYSINITLKSIVVSPDLVNEKDYLIKKEVEDGFDYVLDNKGNVMKDTAGNDIKVKRYKLLQCTVIEKRQKKSAKVSGKIEFYSNNPKALLKSAPLANETFFEHLSARAVGDINALDEKSKKKVSRKPLPFPSDIDMIARTTENLQKSIRGSILMNRNLVK